MTAYSKFPIWLIGYIIVGLVGIISLISLMFAAEQPLVWLYIIWALLLLGYATYMYKSEQVAEELDIIMDDEQ